MKNATVTKSYSLDLKTIKVIEDFAKDRRVSKSDAVREIARFYYAQSLLFSAQEGMRDVANTLGIKTEDDVERIFG